MNDSYQDNNHLNISHNASWFKLTILVSSFVKTLLDAIM